MRSRPGPDGRSVILSSTRGNDANIYIVDLGSRRERQLTSGGGLDVSPIITHRLPLERWSEAFDLIASRHAGKVVLLP